MQSTPVLVIRALGKRYRAGVAGCWADARALVDVNLDIRCREVVAVVGAGGAGKTTLLRCAARLLTPDDGLVEYGRRSDGSESVVRYFTDCVHAERAAERGEAWDLAFIDDIDSVRGDVAFAFALGRVLARAKRDGASVLLAARDARVVGELTDRTLHLEHGRLADEFSVVTPAVARVAEHAAPIPVSRAGPLALPCGEK